MRILEKIRQQKCTHINEYITVLVAENIYAVVEVLRKPLVARLLQKISAS
jgi:hypothetical protein